MMAFPEALNDAYTDSVIFTAIPELATLLPGQMLDYSEQLRRQFDEPVLIKAIKINPGGPYQGFTAPKFPLSVEIRVNERAITQGFVPVATVMPARQANTAAAQGVQPFEWRLLRSIYLRPSDHLSIRVLHERPVGAPVTPLLPANSPYITLVGRRAPKRPAHVFWPWVANFTPPLLDEASAGLIVTERSTEAHLVNTLDRSIFVQRFCLAHWGVWEQDNTTVRASDGFQRILIRNPIPLGAVCPQTDNWWTVNTELHPRNFFRFIFTRDYRAYTGIDNLHGFSLSMHSYYKVTA